MNDADRFVRKATTRVVNEKIVLKQTAAPSPRAAEPSRLYKETPSDTMIRARHVGEAAKALIARRSLVGVAKIRESEELDINDYAPLPPGEYAIIPLSMLKNSDGTGDLRVSDVTQDVLYAQDVTVKDSVTTVAPSTILSKENVARCITLQNKGANNVYVQFDGVYDPASGNTVGKTDPADGVGAWLRPNGSLVINHLVKANPRLISPAGDQLVNVVIQR